MIIKQYTLSANATAIPALRIALDDLAAKIADIPGAIRIDLYRDARDPLRFVMAEQWQSEAAHKAGSGFLAKDAFKPVIALLSAPPVVETLLAVSANGQRLQS